jgi:hypothetical protein
MMETWRDYLRGDEVARVATLDQWCWEFTLRLADAQTERRAISEKARKRMATAHKRAAKEVGQ